MFVAFAQRVARVIRMLSITDIHPRGRVRTTVPSPPPAASRPAPELYRRDLTATEPRLQQTGGFTHPPLDSGEFLRLATVLDYFSRKFVD